MITILLFPATPDVSTYTYDEASGYYYDSVTQYYYDANSQYYYDSKTSKYVYWSPEHQTYLPAPEDSKAGDEDKKKDDKKDKVKTAKRIAKDMEKWAKTLNQKKDAAKQSSVAPVSCFDEKIVNAELILIINHFLIITDSTPT